MSPEMSMRASKNNRPRFHWHPRHTFEIGMVLGGAIALWSFFQLWVWTYIGLRVTLLSGFQLALDRSSEILARFQMLAGQQFTLFWLVPASALLLIVLGIASIFLQRVFWVHVWTFIVSAAGIALMIYFLILNSAYPVPPEYRFIDRQADGSLWALGGFVLAALCCTLAWWQTRRYELLTSWQTDAAFPVESISRRTLLANLGALALLGGAFAGYLTYLRINTVQAFSARLTRRGTPIALSGNYPNAQTLTWSPDGQRIAQAGPSSQVQAVSWDALTGANVVSYINDLSFSLTGVTWSPNSRWLATAGSGDASAFVWEASTGRQVSLCVGSFFDDFNFRPILAWSPDSKKIAGVTRLDMNSDVPALITWDVTTGQPVGRYRLYPERTEAQFIRAIAWSPDGTFIVLSIGSFSLPSSSGPSDNVLTVVDMRSGKVVLTYSLPNQEDLSLGIYTLSCAPDSKRLAYGASTIVGTIDLVGRREIWVGEGHALEVTVVAWAPDGRHIASGGLDTTVQIWDAASGEQRFIYHGHTHPVASVCWSPDSKYLASCDIDGTVKVWEAP